MTVEEGHVLNIDGGGGGGASGNKYKAVNNDRITSGVGRNSHFASNNSDVEDGGSGVAGVGGVGGSGDDGKNGRGGIIGVGAAVAEDVISMSSSEARRRGSKTTAELEALAKLPWYKGVTFKDIKAITPTLLILLVGLLIMIFVIPYAFSSVIKQLEQEQLIEQARLAKRFPSTTTTEESAAGAVNTTDVPDDLEDMELE